jgi:hypothetical protein
MVIKADVPGALRQLAATKRRIRELIEWDDLAQQELRPGLPPSFDPHTSLRAQVHDDIRVFYGLFLSLSSDIEQILQRHDLVCAIEDRTTWRRQLDRLENELLQLRIHERFL